VSEFKNIYIYVSDALRHDHVPETVASEGKVIPTLAPGAYTPISFASLATGLSPENHSVRSFYDKIEQPTVLERFEKSCYYDHPNDTMARNVFASETTSRELDEMQEPFLYIERALDTHEPYGQVKHGNEVPEETEEHDSIQEAYTKGVRSTEEHFWSHVEELKDRGILEDTLVVFTSDHGEFLDEKVLFRRRRGHNQPIATRVSVVPTVFLNHEGDFDHMRTIDIAPTADSLTGGEFECDGVDLTEEQPERGRTMIQINSKPLVATTCTWTWQNEAWRRGLSGIKTDLATLAFDLLKPLKWSIKDSDLHNGLTSSNETAKPVEDIEV
jgi:hypothetical protein